ncbi:kelch-like protein 12 [Orbicella faveolata]|uniref:kelch-like protein 12 n=1 Tax=Orbicella faveolata TaxID=48498 RepID=UPI0009E58125|nr:kelch-like protein 12 [Orbicella faveolata]
MKENNEGVIRQEMIFESQMADILEFIYTDSVQMSTQENAENLIELADYLLLSNLKAFAGKYVEENISTANCISIYYLAKKYLCQDLIDICLKLIYSNFSSVAESDDFLNLSSHEVEKWISSDEIVIDAEENVFELVLRWIDHDKNQRRVKFRD